MNRIFMVAGIVAGLLFATGAEAKDHGNEDGKGHSEASKCPPGLAKKNNGCRPPGLVGKTQGKAGDDETVYFRSYAIGQDLPAGYVVVFDPSLYPFWDSAVYVRYGDFLYLIDRLTGSILLNSGSVDDWTWGWSDVDFAHCPPGLAKKNPPCVPPGQAKKGVLADPYKVGELLPLGYTTILTPTVQSGADASVYARSGDSLYRVAPSTGEVQQQFGEVGRLIK